MKETCYRTDDETLVWQSLMCDYTEYGASGPRGEEDESMHIIEATPAPIVAVALVAPSLRSDKSQALCQLGANSNSINAFNTFLRHQ